MLSAYDECETADDGGSLAESVLIRRRLEILCSSASASLFPAPAPPSVAAAPGLSSLSIPSTPANGRAASE